MKHTPGWHSPAVRAKAVMCRAHKAGWSAVALAVLVVAVAVLLGWHVWTLQQAGHELPAWVDRLRSLGPGDHYARRSGLGAAASVYYSLVCLTFPLGLTAGYGFLTYRRDGTLRPWVAHQREARGAVVCWINAILLPLIGLSFLFAASGANFRKLHVADDPVAMLGNGWIPFFLLGGLAALGPLHLQALRVRRR